MQAGRGGGSRVYGMMYKKLSGNLTRQQRVEQQRLGSIRSSTSAWTCRFTLTWPAEQQLLWCQSVWHLLYGNHKAFEVVVWHILTTQTAWTTRHRSSSCSCIQHQMTNQTLFQSTFQASQVWTVAFRTMTTTIFFFSKQHLHLPSLWVHRKWQMR